jgi:ribosomal protein L12E/L44/L45/RPP1/RPP2
LCELLNFVLHATGKEVSESSVFTLVEKINEDCDEEELGVSD